MQPGMRFLEDPPRFQFFAGKGGVGKTSVACATAVTLAEQGSRVLLVSTDPASNVAQVLGVTIGNTVTAIDDVPGLSALEIDPEQAADAYRERILGPVRGLLPERELASITEQLSGSCTTEVASFNEFTAVLADPDLHSAYDHVIFDTAPTGHTVRLLQLPGSWTDFLMASRGQNLDDVGRANLAEDLLSPCTEEVAVFQQFSKAVNESRREFVVIDTAPTGHTLLLLDAAGSYHRDVVRQMGDSMSFTTPLMRLQDPHQTKVVLVTLAEPTPVTEARFLQDDLERAGIHPWAWLVNNSLLAALPESAFLRARAKNEAEQIETVEAMAERVAIVPLLPHEVVGEAQLTALVHDRQPQPQG